MSAKITKFIADGTFIRFESEGAKLFRATLYTQDGDFDLGQGEESYVDLKEGIDKGVIAVGKPYGIKVEPRDEAGEFGSVAGTTFELKEGALVLTVPPTPDENPGTGGEGTDRLPPREDENHHEELPPTPEPEHHPAAVPPRKEEAPKPPSPAPKPGNKPVGRIEMALTEVVTGIKALAEQGAVNTATLKTQSAAIGTLCGHAEGTRKELGKFDLHLAGHNNSMGKLTEILGNQNTQMGALTLVMDQFRKDANERAARKNETPARTDEPATAKDKNQKKGNSLKKVLPYIPAVLIAAFAAWYFLGDHGKKASSGNGAPPPANAAAIAAEQAAAANNDASGIVVSNGVPIVKGIPSRGQPSITIMGSTNVHDIEINVDNRTVTHPTEVIYAPASERTSTYTAPAGSTYDWHAPGTDTQPSAQASSYAPAQQNTVYVPVPTAAPRRSFLGINLGVSGGGCYGGPGLYPGCYGYGYGGYRKGDQTTVINIRKDTYNVPGRQSGPPPHGGYGPGGHGGSPHWSK